MSPQHVLALEYSRPCMKIVSGAQRPQVARHESAYFLQRESVRLATQLHSRVLSLISLNDVASEHSGADVGGDVSCPGSSHVPHVALHSSAAVPRPQRMAILLGRSATHACELTNLGFCYTMLNNDAEAVRRS